MSANVELLPMFCPRCQNAIPADPSEKAWICAQCGQGMILSDEKALLPYAFHFSAGIPAGASGRPFWVAVGKVSLQRTTFSGDQSGEMRSFWQAGRRFFIPAYELSLDQLIETGSSFVKNSPDLPVEGQPSVFLPVVVGREDIKTLAEFIVMGIEASRSDRLKELKIDLELQEPELWILP